MVINEGSTAYLTVRLLDKAGALAAPMALSYSLRCQTTGAVLRDNVSLTPASQVEITLTPTDNAIQNPANRGEIRLVMVHAQYSGDDALNQEYTYQIRNLVSI